jgi:hypothetical protein
MGQYRIGRIGTVTGLEHRSYSPFSRLHRCGRLRHSFSSIVFPVRSLTKIVLRANDYLPFLLRVERRVQITGASAQQGRPRPGPPKTCRHPVEQRYGGDFATYARAALMATIFPPHLTTVKKAGAASVPTLREAGHDPEMPGGSGALLARREDPDAGRLSAKCGFSGGALRSEARIGGKALVGSVLGDTEPVALTA